MKLRPGQKRRVYACRDGQRFTYNWAISRIKQNPKHTKYSLSRAFTVLRQADPALQSTDRIFQNTTIREARDAADMSFGYGNGNLRFRTKNTPET